MTTSVQIALEHTRTQDTYCVVFNSDATVFAVGTTRGLSVYSADPFVQLVERSVAGGVKLIAMHQQANVLALVPAERSSRILLWDDTRTSAPLRSSTASTATASPQSHATSSDESDVANAQAKLHVVARVDLDSAVAAVKLHKRCLVAASKCQVHLFDASLARVASFESDPAASRALAISTADHIGTFDVNFACAGPSTGTVLLVTYYDTHALKQYVNAQSKGSTSSSPPMGSSRVTSARGAAPAVPQAVKLGSGYHQTLAAPHSTTLANLAITADGSLALTASVQGTALKLIDVKSGVVMRQLNRGRLTNTIQSMAFNTNATLAAVVSETGTVHLFAVQPTNQVRATNPRSVFTRVAQTVGESMTASTYQRSHDDHPYAPYGDAASARAAVPAAHTASGSGRVQNYVSFAQGEFAFAKFDLTTCDDSPHGRRLFHGSLVGLRTGVDNQGRATLLIAQADWGRLLKIHVDVTERGEALLATSGNAAGASSPEGANGPTQANRCALVSTWRFPSVPLL